MEDVHLALSRLNSNQDLTSKGIGYGSKNVGYLVLGGKIEGFKQICQMMGISKPISYNYIEANGGKRKWEPLRQLVRRIDNSNHF